MVGARMILGRLWCWAAGHRRGKLVANVGIGVYTGQPRPHLRTFQCPRCSATWTRKVKAAKVAQ